MAIDPNKSIDDLAEQQKIKQTSLKEVEAAFFKQLHDFIDEDPEKFIRYVCDLVIGEADWARETIAAESHKDPGLSMYEAMNRVYGNLARIILNNLDTINNKKDISGFVSLREWIISETDTVGYHISKKYTSVHFRDICHTFFEQYRERFGVNFYYVSHMVFFGVPIYQQETSSGNYVLVDEQDEDFVYLKKRGEYSDSYSFNEMPKWTEKFYINSEHVKWHYKFSSDENSTEEENNIRRDAYRKMIGVPMSNIKSPAFGETSRLHKLMQKVIDRYYGSNFDPNDSDTWPRQVDIVDWLQSEHALSKREAEAIDIVTRPDRARNK